MTQEPLDATAFVTLTTSPEPDPALPPWWAQGLLLMLRARDSGVLTGMQQTVRVPRGRIGRYEVCDFAAVLILYALSAAATLETLYAVMPRCAPALFAAWRRERVPSRSALCRFLQEVSPSALEALRAVLFEDLLTHGLRGDLAGGLYDREGRRHLVFDVDGTHQVARQRSLVADAEHPPVRRRLDALCAPGYTGRKRGEVTRTRTAVAQAHTREWLGSWGTAGNGDHFADLERACESLVRYLTARELSAAQGIVRTDGMYGCARGAWISAQHGLGYLLRCADYRLLDLPAVQAVLAEPPCARMVQTDTGTEREVWDVPAVLWQAALEPTHQVVTRLIVTARRFDPKSPPTVGQRRGERVFELFATDRDGRGLSPLDVLSLYFARGGFEQTLAEEDEELELDRWCSGHPEGQEFWQLLGQWVWNVRLELGLAARQSPVRRTLWSNAVASEQGHAATAAPRAPVTVPQPAPALPSPTPPAPASAPADCAPGEVVAASGRGTGKFSGKDFSWTPEGLLQCPGAQLLALTSRRVEGNRVRLRYEAPAAACAGCSLASSCRGAGSSGDRGRRVSVWQVGAASVPASSPVPTGSVSAAAPTVVPSSPGSEAVWWIDVPSTWLRRVLREVVCGQRSEVEEPVLPSSAPLTRARRAHRRRTWVERLARNALPPLVVPWRVRLHGVPDGLAAHLAAMGHLRRAA